ncbi:MAG: ATP synthase subunit I [Deltaproteobacteria bacterium]|nr:ATP synthase subunit I [Deltaproteobacteria bacterium]
MPHLSFIERLSLLLVVLATLVCLVAGHRPMSLGAGVGGLLAVANFFALRRLMLGIVRSNHPPRQIVLTLLLLVKIGVLGGAIYLVMTRLPVDPKGMLLGVSVVVLSIFVEGFRTVLRGAAAQSE